MGIVPVQVQVLSSAVIAEKTIEKSMVFFYAGRIRHTFNGCLK